MKTSLIVGIIIGIVIFGSFSFVYALMYDCLNPPVWMKIPKSDFRYCLGLLANGHLPDYPNYSTYEEYRGAMYGEPESKPSLCAKYDGRWDDEHLTCDYVNADSCSAMKGEFQECKTPEYRCPHHNPECFVTAECISSCIFEDSLKAGEKN